MRKLKYIYNYDSIPKEWEITIWDDYTVLEELDNKQVVFIPNKILKKVFEKEKKCYHQWRYFNKWCQECSEFGHGIIVSHCFKCGKLWDKENGFWTKEEINNVFFNEHFQTGE